MTCFLALGAKNIKHKMRFYFKASVETSFYRKLFENLKIPQKELSY